VNLRILKKLSKRAAPLLPLLDDKRKQFRAERQDSYTGMIIRARKHWERGRSSHPDLFNDDMLKRPARDGKGGWIYMTPPSHPLKGTIMVGAVSGYYEPEWDEQTSWEALECIVRDYFCDWSEDGPTPTRQFRTPSDVLRGAHDIVADRK